MENDAEAFDLIIVGAGPIGLAAACAAREARLRYVVIDKAGICQSITEFAPRQSFYSPADELEIGGVPFPIAGDEKPRREDTLAYYRAVVASLRLNIRSWERVDAVRPDGDGLAVTTVQEPDGAWTRVAQARNVLLANGVWDQPRRLDVPGAALRKVISRYIDPTPYYGRNCLVVGGGNSAAEVAMALSKAGAHTRMAMIEGNWDACHLRPFVLREMLLIVEERKVLPQFCCRVARIDVASVTLETPAGAETIDNDFVFAMIGNDPDTRLLEAAGVEVCEGDRRPVYDEATFETRVPGLYVAGSITREPHIVNGRPRATKIVNDIAKRLGKA
ncbi:MAG: NAD(P)-binding domain-containing protein [Capsulimonadaceae bacterium]|nr:NAD(P)-binding domain-containing protein [Capsulimonadaceae bacterium]